MRRKRLWTWLLVALFVLMLAAEALAVVKLFYLDMLPPAYLMILVAVFAVFSLGIGLLAFIRTWRPAKIRKIIAAVLAVLLFCGCTAIATVADDVMKTLEATTREFLEIPTREVYVLADSPAQELETADGYTYGYLKNYDENCTQQALEKIAKRIGREPATAGFTNISTMAMALLDNRIDAIVLNGGLISILEDAEEFSAFSTKTRILAQIRVDEEAGIDGIQMSAQEEADSPEETYAIQEQQTDPTEEAVDFSELKPFVVYVSGSDSYETEVVKYGRSDVNILAVVNPLTKQVLLISTPRDYYVDTTAKYGEKDKLTHCGIYGTKCSMRTLGNLYGVDIEYFVRVNFTGFKKLIDAMGGVTVYSDYAFTAITRTDIKEGENHLTGQQALDFARERVTLPGGDNDRGKNQMKVITAVIEKATTGTTIITNYSDILASVEGMFTMNLPTELISELMKMQLGDMARWNVVSYSATGYYAKKETYSMPGVELSVLEPNYASIRKAARLIDMVYAGELLTEEVIAGIVG